MKPCQCKERRLRRRHFRPRLPEIGRGVGGAQLGARSWRRSGHGRLTGPKKPACLPSSHHFTLFSVSDLFMSCILVFSQFIFTYVAWFICSP